VRCEARVSGADVVVVGGGAIGVACAYELARAGAQVTLLEAGSALGGGCSGGSAGLLCPSHAAPLATRAALGHAIRWSLSREAPLALRPRPALIPWLARFLAACTPERERAASSVLRALSISSLALHERLRREIGIRLEPSGTLNVYETVAGLEHGRRESLEHAAAGLRCERLSEAEACALEPALSAPIAGAIYYPDELSGDPLDFVRVLAAAAEDAGATIRAGTEVLSLERRGSRIVRLETTAGPIAAGTLVLAAGAWTPRLAHHLRLSIPVEAGKGYHLDYEARVGDPRVPIFLREAHVVVTPLPGRIRLAGTLALSGLDTSIDSRRLAAIERSGVRRVPALAGRSAVELWRGLRPCSPDGLPIVGRPGRYENVLLATGHAMLGFTLAPLTGRSIARLALGEEPDDDIAPLHPDRFRGRGPLLPLGSQPPRLLK
jgi:D-amino-acid dehydrogenase